MTARPNPRTLVLALSLPLLLAPARLARGDAYEGFDYPAGRDIPMSGGSGFAPRTGSSGQVPWSIAATVAPGSLSDPTGTLATTGNHLTPSFPPIRRLEQVMGAPGTDVWISFLQRRDRNLNGFQGLLLSEPRGTGSVGTYFIGEPGFGPADGTYVIGKAGDDFNVVSSGVAVVPNETAFLVAHLQFREGNDLATLYVNPAPGAAAPAGGVTYSGFDMPLVNPILSLQILSPSSGPTVLHSFDEVRIGDSYAEVAPAVPEPAAAALVACAAGLLLPRRRKR